jgi:hypothetical protein
MTVKIFIISICILLVWFSFGIYLGRKSVRPLPVRIFDAESHHWVNLERLGAKDMKLYCLDPDGMEVPCVEYGRNADKTAVALYPLSVLQFTVPTPQGQNQVEK